MRVELILEAIDRASAPIQKVHGAMDGLGKVQFATAAATGARGAQALAHADRMAAAAAQRDQARGAIVDAIATAASVAAPITKAVQQFNAYEDILNEIGLKSNATGKELAAFGERVRAQSKAVNMASTDMLTGIDKLAAGGVSMKQAEEAFPALARASVATKASMDDLSKTAVSLINNLKVDPGSVTRALDAMAQAGKDGQFELKDMAQFFPKLGAQYAAMGQTGQKAVVDLSAALQVMRKNVGTPGEAVTNLQDLLNKVTLKPAEKAFKEAGIDIQKVMEKARKEGTVFESIFDALNKATGGDTSKLQSIFSDKQALAGAQALMQHYQEFLKMREAAQGASGVVDRDFATRMGLGVEKTRAFTVAMSELGVTVGQALAPMVGAKMDALTKMVWQLQAWAKANPELVASIAQVATAVAGFLVVMAVAKFAFAILKWGVLSALTPLRLLGRVMGLLLSPVRFLIGLFGGMATALSAAAAAAGGWGVLLAALGRSLVSLLISPLMLAARAFAFLGAAMMATPVGWIVAALAAIAGAAYLIYRNWDRIVPFMQGVWNGIVAGLGNAWSAITAWASKLGQSILTGLQSGWTSVTAWFASLSWPELPSFTALIGDVFAPIVTALTAGWRKIADWFSSLTWPPLPSIPDPLVGIRAVLEPVLAWVTDWGGRLFGAFEGAFTRIGTFIEGAGARLSGVIGSVTSGLSKVSDMIFGPSQASVAATKQEIAAVQAAIAAIAPAAQAAVQQASAILAGANFHSHGVAMMATLAQGIRAGAAQAVAAATETVQKIRNLLPHSPAKEGPLSDLHRVKFGQTLAGAIQLGTPAAVAAAAGMAAGLMAAVPTSMAAPAVQQAMMAKPSAGAGGSGGAGETGDRSSGPITVNLTLSPSFAGGGGSEFVDQLRTALPDVAHELAEALRTELDRRDRVKH
jgi:TP901 family phage tail tape measure protein